MLRVAGRRRLAETTGQDMKMLRRQWVQDRDGFLLVYSMVDRRSFEELDHFLNLIRSLKPDKQVPIVLVANKADLKVSGRRRSLSLRSPIRRRNSGQ